jgi:CRISPR-associated protein Csd1
MNTFDVFCQRLMQHQERLRIIRPSYDSIENLSVSQLLFETVNKNAKDKKASAILTGSLMHAILNDTPYPAALFQGVIIRVRADRDINRKRAAIIKAYLLKIQTNDNLREVLTVQLNEQSKYVPYVMGRLFSILENIQQVGNPSINATIKDRYFNAASATPAVIFPLLLKLKNNHMRIIIRDKKHLAIHFEKQIGSLLDCIQQQLPNHLTLEEQGAFILGYYHQTQSRYKSKEVNNNG